MGATKITTVESAGVKLAETCKDITKYDCAEPTWTTHQDGDDVTPPDGTVAIVVDLRNAWGSIRIYQKQSDDYVDMVGMDEKPNLVIVPWQGDWTYLCTGSPQVGCVMKIRLS